MPTKRKTVCTKTVCTRAEVPKKKVCEKPSCSRSCRMSCNKCPCIPCPVPTKVPRIVSKGGIDVLNIIPGPDTTMTVEVILQPRMGNDVKTNKWYGYSDPITVTNAPTINQLPTYSTAKIKLPALNEDMTCENLYMWEAVVLKTELIGVTSLITLHTPGVADPATAPALPVEGVSFHFFAVGGQPLDLQYCVPAADIVYPDGTGSFASSGGTQQTYDASFKAILDRDGYYPVEAWAPDPVKNDNSRYYGTVTGGTTTPPVLSTTNAVSTVLLDDRGVGPLCKGDGLYVTAVDICGVFQMPDNTRRHRGLARYFQVQLRQRAVRNPYPVNSLLNSLLTKQIPTIDGQPMDGTDNQVQDVTVFQGTEPLPGDPTLTRHMDLRCCPGTPVTDMPSDDTETPVAPAAR